jgi:cysteine desulfurase family protein (TIGR01976 family)
MQTLAQPSIEQLRSQFPSLAQPIAFMENAGGSQAPAVVIDAIADYMRTSFVQLGAPYPLSKQATDTVDAARAFALRLFGGQNVGHAILGNSTSALCQTLAQAIAPLLAKRPEVVIAEFGHEANIGPWLHIGAEIKWWRLNPETLEASLDDLADLISDRTLLVAFPHVSNLLGEVLDVQAITEKAHEVGAQVVVDGVAFAPHRLMDVTEWGVDWYVFSFYKVFGPHAAALFGRYEAAQGLVGPNHFFIPPSDLEHKFELGGVNHEAMAGVVALQRYLAFVAGNPGNEADRPTIESAFQRFEALELPLQEKLVAFLAGHPQVKLVGPKTAGKARVPTISFVHAQKPSDHITAALAAQGFAMRHGHMYSYRLLEALGIPPDPGVVRLSLVHTNTQTEVDQVIAALDQIL